MQRCAIDDDMPQQNLGPILTSQISEVGDINNNSQDTNHIVEDFSKRLSCKWSNGTGPRIGCVRDYPEHLQSRALEQVHLSPRPTSSRLANYGPIPSPRPSPKLRVSPRLAYMGLPSPRTTIPAP